MDIAVDIDDRLTTLMALATQPPAIVRPYFDAGRRYQNLIGELTSDDEIYQNRFEAWVSKVGNSRNFMIKLFDDHAANIASKHVALLLQFAQLFEKKADLSATELTSYQKQSNKALTKLKAVKKKQESVQIKSIFEAAYSRWHEEIKIYLDMALLFRGLAGKYDPDQQIIFTAESSEDIDKFFESAELN